jgi:hypothetical protein
MALHSNPPSSDTDKSDGAADEAVLNIVHETQQKSQNTYPININSDLCNPLCPFKLLILILNSDYQGFVLIMMTLLNQNI